MPRPGEDRSDVGGAVQFNNIGPVPLSIGPVRFRFPSPEKSKKQELQHALVLVRGHG